MFDSPFSISSILGLPSKNSSEVPMTTSQHLARATQPDKHSYKIPYNEYGTTSTKPLIQPSKKKVLTTSSTSSSSSSSSSRKMTTTDDKKTKRFRSSFSTEQLRTMEDTFRHRPYLSTAQVEELAGKLAVFRLSYLMYLTSWVGRSSILYCTTIFLKFLLASKQEEVLSLSFLMSLIFVM